MAVTRGGPGGAIRLQLALEGERQIDVALSRFGEDIADWRPFFSADLAPKLFGLWSDNFDSEGKYVGGWAPLAPAYAAWKAKRYPGRKILVRTEALKRSLSMAPGSARPGKGGILRVTKNSLEAGTSVKHAKHHQEGTNRMPRRQIIFLMSAETAGRMLHDWLVRRAKQRGLNPGNA